MIKKIIYFISIICFCFFTFLVVEMLPIIFQSNWQGYFFLVGFIALLIFELIFLIKKHSFMKNYCTYNLFIISITMYLSVFYYKIYSIKPTTTSFYYDIDISYCQQNYLILAITFLFSIFYLFVLKREENKIL